MGINFKKIINLTNNIKANISKKGVSFTGKFGPITLNSKGRGSIKLGKGINHTFKWKK